MKVLAFVLTVLFLAAWIVNDGSTVRGEKLPPHLQGRQNSTNAKIVEASENATPEQLEVVNLKYPMTPNAASVWMPNSTVVIPLPSLNNRLTLSQTESARAFFPPLVTSSVVHDRVFPDQSLEQQLDAILIPLMRASIAKLPPPISSHAATPPRVPLSTSSFTLLALASQPRGKFLPMMTIEQQLDNILIRTQR